MKKGLICLVVLVLLLSGCSRKVICPAYQSSFIHDKETLRSKFSYFDADSTPKLFQGARKNQYLVAVPESYRKKFRRLQTVEMKTIYPVLPESLPGDTTKTGSAPVASADSTALPPVDESGLVQKSMEFRITKTPEKYNNDQDYYMWFFRRSLLLPDIRYTLDKRMANRGQEEQRAAVAAKSKPRKEGGLRKLNPFKRKKEEPSTVEDNSGQGTGSRP